MRLQGVAGTKLVISLSVHYIGIEEIIAVPNTAMKNLSACRKETL